MRPNAVSFNAQRPLVGVSACAKTSDDGRTSFTVGEKYVQAVAEAAQCLPMLIPPIASDGDTFNLDALLDRLDGVFLTGSPSNLHPSFYGEETQDPAILGEELRDPRRDATTLPLIRRGIERGVPIFAVCRGHQELNAALGGSLYQSVHTLPGKQDHRMDRTLPPDARYHDRHALYLTPGGVLATLNGGETQAVVNSLHAQAINQLGDTLVVEAMSEDGVIEAVSCPNAKAFTLGVQWHPEHRTALENPLNRALFTAFGDACRQTGQTRVPASSPSNAAA